MRTLAIVTGRRNELTLGVTAKFLTIGVITVMSYYEARKLDQLERDLRQDSPQLARQFERFGFRLVLLRLIAVAIGTIVAVAFMFVEKSIDAFMTGSGLLALFGWELRRRAVQLRHLPRSGRLTVSRRQQ